MNINTELIDRITNYITSQTDKINKNELKKAIGKIYDDIEKSNKKDEPKKRQPSPYNNFVKEKMNLLKNDVDNKMNQKEKMEYIASLWKQEKDKIIGKTPRKGLAIKKE
jgi:hypothetical protein